MSYINTYDEYCAPGAANTGRFQYTGQAWLPEAQLYHFKARVYIPALGRFAQTDPILFDGGINIYAYAANDPINILDNMGTAPDVVEDTREKGDTHALFSFNESASSKISTARSFAWDRRLPAGRATLAGGMPTVRWGVQ